jgi:predicted RNA-binding protein YlqC (UPF0109 family)
MPERSEGAIQEMLLSVIRSLVDAPDDVKVEPMSGEGDTVFRVEVNPSDVGRLIGRHGQTARALEVIANPKRTGRSFRLDIDRGAGTYPRT